MAAETTAAWKERARAHLTSRVRLWTGQPFREPFLSREPPFRAGDVALDFPRRHALLRAALDAFCDVDLRLEHEREREDVRILLKQVERRLPAVREAAHHFDYLVAGEERARAEAEAFARSLGEVADQVRSILEQSQEAVQSLAAAAERALKQSFLEPERVTQMTLQRDPALEGYLKVSSAAKKWKSIAERIGAAWKNGLGLTSQAGAKRSQPQELQRLHPEFVKNLDEILYGEELLKEVQGDIPLFEAYGRAIGAHPALLQASQAAAQMVPYFQGPLGRARAQLRGQKIPDLRPVDPVARARFLELSREFPWVEEYRKVLAYGEALRNRLQRVMEETAPGAERAKAQQRAENF